MTQQELAKLSPDAKIVAMIEISNEMAKKARAEVDAVRGNRAKVDAAVKVAVEALENAGRIGNVTTAPDGTLQIVKIAAAKRAQAEDYLRDHEQALKMIAKLAPLVAAKEASAPPTIGSSDGQQKTAGESRGRQFIGERTTNVDEADLKLLRSFGVNV